MAFLDGVRRRERFGEVFLPAVSSRARFAVCHAELGMFPEGTTLGEEGLQIAEAVDHPASLTVASWGIGLLFLRQGELPRALPRLERAVSICHEADLPAYFPEMAAALGAAYALAERVADAVPLLMQALAQATAMQRVDDMVLCCLSLGEAHLLAGRQAYALRLLGDIAARREPPEAAPAADHYRQALARAEILGMHPLQAHCHRGFGTLYARIGQREQAHAALSTAVELYRAMEMSLWLPQAEAALAQMA